MVTSLLTPAVCSAHTFVYAWTNLIHTQLCNDHVHISVADTEVRVEIIFTINFDLIWHH